MHIEIRCSRCGCKFERPESLLGSIIPCPDCGQRLRVGAANVRSDTGCSLYPFDKMLETKMSWLSRIIYRKEIAAVREAVVEREKGLVTDIIFGDAGILDGQRVHAEGLEGKSVWALTDRALVMGRGALVESIEYVDIRDSLWKDDEFHLVLEAPYPQEGFDFSGLWLRPAGDVSLACKKAIQAVIAHLMAAQRAANPTISLPEWAQAMPDFLRPDLPKIEELEALRKEYGYAEEMFAPRIMCSPATTRRSMRWRCDLIRKHRPTMAEREVLREALMDRLIYTSGITGAALFAEGLESWVPESVKRHFPPVGDEEEPWGKVSLLTPDEVKNSMMYVKTLDDACELVIAVETLVKISDYNGAGHRVEAILGETRPDGQCQMYDRCPPPLPWIAELLDQWRLHDREDYARERAGVGAFAWGMFMELMKEAPDGDALLKTLEDDTGRSRSAHFSFSRAVEELFMLDNIDPLKWMANWRAISSGLPSDLRYPLSGLGPENELDVQPTPSAEEFFSVVTRPLLPAWLLAAYPDVYHWFNQAESKEITERQKDETWNGTSRLQAEIFGSLDEEEQKGLDEKEQQREGMLKLTRALVDYYRKHVNWRLECES